MRVTEVIKQDVTKYFKDMQRLIEERPLACIIYTLAISTFAAFVAFYHMPIALGIFSLCVPLHIALIINIRDLKNNLEVEFERGSKKSYEEKGKSLDKFASFNIKNCFNFVKEFFNGFFNYESLENNL